MKILLAFVLLMPLMVAASAEARGLPPERMAAESDVVVVAQLERTDYEYRRGFPVAGRAWFRVLISYKNPRRVERLIVHEEGIKDIECYFPDDPGAIEQPRYLLFLKRDAENRLRGHPAGCALELLVTSDSRYALRWPQESMVLDDEGLKRVQEFEFQGPLSRIDASDETRTAREAMAERNYMRIDGTDLYYTRGILLGDFRRLMAAGLTADADDRVERRKQRILEAIEDDDGET